MRFFRPQRMLAVYSAINILLCCVAISGSGMITICAVIAIAFFMSIMFPTIFSLGIAGLGADAKYGSSLIIMSIAGGAVLPPVMAQISDTMGTMQAGYVVPMICFAVTLIFGLFTHRIKQPLTHA
jgi:FHS family L-fucose permease-like MFS transporter